MQATIITIGEELLIGQVSDTNSTWMARELSMIGLRVKRQLTISDNAEDIKDALDIAISDSDVVLMTGGLGPTRDDITKHTLATYFHSELVLNQEVYEHVAGIVKKYKTGMNNLNTAQAMVPEKCTVLFNDVGTAPGMMFMNGNKRIFSMPGVPHEMRFLFNERIKPILLAENNQVIRYRNLRTTGKPEAGLALLLEEWENQIPGNLSLAYLPSFGEIRLRLTAIGTNADDIELQLTKEQEKIAHILGDLIFSVNDESLEEVIGKLLTDKKLLLSTAESCTGGYIASRITSVPGASNYFKGSIIAYSNEVKEKQLKVSHEIIQEYGAVSKEVVERMAFGINALLHTDISIAVSGIAGPGGGMADKPVGTVWIAVAYKNSKVLAQKFNFHGKREFIVRRSTVAALDMLRKFIISEFSLKKE